MQNLDFPQPEPQLYEIPDEVLHSLSKSVLILEDDSAFADLLKQTLEEQDYRVTIVADGAKGVQQIIAADFDAILCDMVMPNFPGDMFYLAVQRARPHLCPQFVFMTGHQNDPKIAKFIEQSGCVALWKPFQMRDLFAALETLASRSK